MDVSALLEPRDDESPSGENLEYDPAFTEMELAAQPGEERQMGDEVVPGDPPEYRDVLEKAEVILGRSHDLRAGVYAAQAQLNVNGLPGFAEATAYLRGCLEQHWATCHPQLDEDDDDDPTMRINAIVTLADQSLVVRAIRRAPLTESRTFGRVSLRDILVAEGEMTPREDEAVPDSATVAAAFKDTDADTLAAIVAAAHASIDNIAGISAVFDEHTPGQGPELDPLIRMLKTVLQKMSALGGVDAGEPEAADADEGGTAAPQASGGGGGGSGAINSPNDVINALERIMEYYKRQEPSSPVPIILDRAKRLVNADFVTIIKDMAPMGLDNVNTVGGLEGEEY